MKPNTPLAAPLPAAGTSTASNAGVIVRTARLAAGLTLADLGHRCGYSASQISRYERGVQPLTDITLLRRLAEALTINPQEFGLAPPIHRADRATRPNRAQRTARRGRCP